MLDKASWTLCTYVGVVLLYGHNEGSVAVAVGNVGVRPRLAQQ